MVVSPFYVARSAPFQDFLRSLVEGEVLRAALCFTFLQRQLYQHTHHLLRRPVTLVGSEMADLLRIQPCLLARVNGRPRTAVVVTCHTQSGTVSMSGYIR